jgi:hypothetical protein
LAVTQDCSVHWHWRRMLFGKKGERDYVIWKHQAASILDADHRDEPWVPWPAI